MVAILGIVVIFFVLVGLHELGHFLAARACGLAVPTFSIGFGPPIASWKWGHSRIQIGPIPFGGFVSLLGETAGEEQLEALKKNGSAEECSWLEDRSRWFDRASGWKQAATVLAGPLASLAAGWLFFSLTTLIMGAVEEPGRYFVGEVQDRSAAARAGINAGDEIVTAGGRPVRKHRDIVIAVQLANPTLELRILREGREQVLLLKPDVTIGKDTGKQVKIAGIVSAPLKFRKAGILDACADGLQNTWEVFSESFSTLGWLVTGKVSLEQLSGPVGIGTIIAKSDPLQWLPLAAVLSVALGFFNLLPIPLLDGSLAIWAGYKIVTGREAPVKARGILNVIGILMLAGLMTAVLVGDIAALM